MAILKILNKNKKEMPKRYWNFPFANKFMKDYLSQIELFELRMFRNREVGEVFIKNGNMIRAMGATYQMLYSKIDGVLYTVRDIPAIHVKYKGGAEEWIACYVEMQNGKLTKYHKTLRKL